MILNSHYMITLALVFVMFATGAYKKSYSTAMFIVAIAIAMFFIKPCTHNISKEMALYFVNIISFFAVIRAILQKDFDKFIKGGDR